jgi:hypothetical protein
MEIDGDYILSWAFTFPNDLQNAILGLELNEAETIQANAIIEVLQYLLPPTPDPKNWHFLIQLREGPRFHNFRVVPKRVKARRVGEYSSTTLSLAPRDWYRGGYERLVRRFHQEFFGHKPTVREMEEFILKPGVSDVDYETALASSECNGPNISN